ncbi:hypothetical protein BM526_19980 (plasmid) [Alteromonas mediterranea]|uniref:hypothetical protein n=1 Tax=Alteromonas mediterranea TaxID=314275 RepID=UPI000903163E|nr:hypothetical protein [Alteromonas mediterranea]APE04252.1 hypothetical protein BM526_19980 [Alteromonas mediterranea]
MTTDLKAQLSQAWDAMSADRTRNQQKQQVVVEVKGVVDIGGTQYLEGVRKSLQAPNGDKVLVAVPEDIHEKKRMDFDGLMSPSNKNQVSEGGVIYFRDCLSQSPLTIEDQEYNVFLAEYYDVMQHKSGQENSEFMKNFANQKEGDQISVQLEGQGYTNFWSQRQADGTFQPKGKTVIFRLEDARMRTVSSMEELKQFIKDSFHEYKPTGLQAQEIRRLRIIFDDEAFDTRFEISSLYEKDAFVTPDGKHVGGYPMDDEFLDKQIERYLSPSYQNGERFRILQANFEKGASFDLELLPAKSFRWGKDSLMDSNLFQANGSIAPAKKEGGMAPIEVVRNQFKKTIPVQTEDGKIDRSRKHDGIAPISMSIRIKKGEEGQVIFCTNAIKNAAMNYVIDLNKAETPNFKRQIDNEKSNQNETQAETQKAKEQKQTSEAVKEQTTQKAQAVNDTPKFDETDVSDDELSQLDGMFENDNFGMRGPA